MFDINCKRKLDPLVSQKYTAYIIWDTEQTALINNDLHIAFVHDWGDNSEGNLSIVVTTASGTSLLWDPIDSFQFTFGTPVSVPVRDLPLYCASDIETSLEY